jgi:2-amino-4-hydroxy-6-hydroxymethyldihydropteridine diphosphokinase
MVTGVFLLLGSNEGDKNDFLRKAKERITAELGAIISSSSIYATAAWGKTDQSDFLNQVVEIQTSIEPQLLLEKILLIEKEIGRIRKEKWGPRPIDIDILFYSDRILATPALTIPHAGIPHRRFVLVPLLEIAPTLTHPVLNKSIEKLLKECDDILLVTKVE